jgi:hypothetical protein
VLFVHYLDATDATLNLSLIPYHKLILHCYGAQTFFQVLNRAQSQAIPIPSTTQEMQMLNQETTTFVEV